MGESKAALFLARVATAAGTVFDRVVAVERAGGPQHAIPTIFEDVHEAQAPIFGVTRALADARGRSFILATDYALVTPGVLEFLRRRFEQSSASMLVPVWGGVPQILCAGYATCLIPALDARIASRRLDIRGVLEETDVELVEEAELRARFDGEPLLNVNTPSDLAVAERYL